MAYTDPKTWSVAEFVTAALLNTHLRDQLKYLGGADGRGTTLPVSPVDGQLFVYVADAGAGVEWLLKYNAGDAGSFKWHVIGGVKALAGVVATDEATTSNTYVALATAGPTVTAPLAGDYLVTVECYIEATNNGATGVTAHASYDVGATAAVDGDSARVRSGGTSDAIAQSVGASAVRTRLKTGLVASTALTMKYHTGSAISATFGDRRISVVPVRVG